MNDHFREGLTCHALRDIYEQHVSDVGIRKPFAGREEHAWRQHSVEKLLSRPRSIWLRTNRFVLFGHRAIIAQSARVTKQVRQRDGGGNADVR